MKNSQVLHNDNGFTVTKKVSENSYKAIAKVEYVHFPDDFQQSFAEAKTTANICSDAINTSGECGLMPSELLAERNELLDMLQDAKLQLEYLQEKFIPTGSSTAVISKIDTYINNINK